MYRERDPLWSDEVFRELLVRARQEDSVAMDELWQAVAPRLREHAERILPATVRQRCNPSDLITETYIRFRKGLVTFEGGSGGNLEAWLLTILKNLMIDIIRPPAQQPIGSIDPSDSGSTPSSGLRRSELQEQVRRCLAKLSDDDRQALELRVICNLSHLEAAQIVGVKADTFGRRFLRALDRLEKLLRENGIDPREFGTFS